MNLIFKFIVRIGGQLVGVQLLELKTNVDAPAEIRIRTGLRTPMPELYNHTTWICLRIPGDSGQEEIVGDFRIVNVVVIDQEMSTQLYQYEITGRQV